MSDHHSLVYENLLFYHTTGLRLCFSTYNNAVCGEAQREDKWYDKTTNSLTPHGDGTT
jgi:hypothetical protein